MDTEHLDKLKDTLRKLPPSEQDQLAGLLLVERMKRNQLVMPAIHKRIDDAEPENWQTWDKAKDALGKS